MMDNKPRIQVFSDTNYSSKSDFVRFSIPPSHFEVGNRHFHENDGIAFISCFAFFGSSLSMENGTNVLFRQKATGEKYLYGTDFLYGTLFSITEKDSSLISVGNLFHDENYFYHFFEFLSGISLSDLLIFQG
jgi:hypothetical protein